MVSAPRWCGVLLVAGGSVNDPRFAMLNAELNAIHVANVLYWTKGAEADAAARGEYFQRQNRIVEIRSQFVALNSVLAWQALTTTFRRIRHFSH
jgi:hypothetical protein